MSRISPDQLLHLIRIDDPQTLRSIYLDNKLLFLNYAKGYGISEEDAMDVYHDAIIVLRENVQSGKLVELTCDISTYLFAIGKYKFYQILRQNNSNDKGSRIRIADTDDALDVQLFEQQYSDRQTLISEAINQMGGRCREILTLFYIKSVKLDEIAKLLDYSNKDVLKSQKSRCLKQLKDKIKNRG